jgi:hypothetical protein
MGQSLVIFRNFIPDMLSIVIGNLLLILGYFFLCLGVRDLLNLDAQWHNRFFIPIGMALLGLVLFTYVYQDVAMRIIICSILGAWYSAIIAFLFFNNKLNKFKIINNISALLFFIGAVIFFSRSVIAFMVYLPINYLSMTDINIILIYGYLFFLTIWLGIVLIMHLLQNFQKKIVY